MRGDGVTFEYNTSWDNARGYYAGDTTAVSYNIAGEATDQFGGGFEDIGAYANLP